MPNQRERNAIPSADRAVRDKYQRFAIRLAFDGTTYQGFQSQPSKNTIQDQLEHRLRGLLRRDVKVMAWGRTDSGVHAEGAVVTVDLSLDEVTKFAKKSSQGDGDEDSDNGMKAASFLHSVLKEFACNTDVGEDGMPQTRYGSISAQAVKPVPQDFDARYSATSKTYVYYICACDGGSFLCQLPFIWTRYAWQVRQSLDLAAMTSAAEMISGEHNFEWMCVMQQGELRSPRRTVHMSVETIPINSVDGEGSSNNMPYFLQYHGGTVIYKITGTCDFFLYKMMRRVVGVLVAIGKHDADLDTLKNCIDAYDNDRKSLARLNIPKGLLQTAPAKGLCLDHIEYDTTIC